MQEHVPHIELMNKSRAQSSQGEDCANSGWLDCWAEGLIVGDIGPQDEPSKDLVSLVSF
jgi:hypothetical protein